MQLLSFPIEISLTDKEKCELSAKEILMKLKPEWTEDEINFEVFTVGITNKIFSAFVNEEDRLIFRVFGKNTEKIIDRPHELESWAILSKEGLAAPLLAKFSNGIVCGYLPGKSLDVEKVREPEMARKIAEAVAQMHKIDTGAPKKPCGFVKMRKFERNISPQFECTDKQRIYNEFFADIDLKTKMSELEVLVKGLGSEVAFCHNDLLVHNILYDDKTDKVYFIDYEYADFNYALFDIGNHFCEYAGVDNTDYSLCPTKEQKRVWLSNYLTAREGSPPEKIVLDKYLKETPLFEAMSHLFWSSWALVQSQNSTIDFDYLGYAILRYKMYNTRLQTFNTGNSE